MTTTAAPTPVNTAKVKRRTLHFNTLDEALAEVDRLVAADHAGKLKLLGNWTLGQNLNHVASWVGWSFDGVPFTTPGFVKFIMKMLMKRKFIDGPMPVGARIPQLKAQGGTIGQDLMSTDDASAKIHAAFARLKAGPPTQPHTLFGPLTHEEWIKTHLRHAELHLSFCEVA